MRASFLAVAGSVVALYAGAFVVGLMVDGERFFLLHFALGLCAIVFTLLLHCLVMTFLIVSGKVVRLAVEQSRLDRDFIVRTREIKAQTFPFMVAAIVVVLAAAFFGAGATDRPALTTLHLIAALVAVTYNTFTFFVEYRQVGASADLQRRALDQHNAIRDAKQAAAPEGK